MEKNESKKTSLYKCIWTGDYSENTKSIELETLDRFGFSTKKIFHIKPEFEDDLKEYNSYLKKYGRTFIGLILFISFLLITAPFIALAMGYSENIVLDIIGILIFLLGLVIILLPLPTPETIKWLGVIKAIYITRVLGIVTLLFGIVLFIF